MDKRFLKPTETNRVEQETFAKHEPEAQDRILESAHAEADVLNVQTFAEKIAAEQDEKAREELMLAQNVATVIHENNGLALVVGGYARDEVLRKFGYDVKPKDIDLEVYGVEPEKLKEILSQFGSVNVAGEQFGVIKLKSLDIAIPRTDSKSGIGHKGFTIQGDPWMDIKDAARRRDFTMNALGLNPLTGEMVDPYGGIDDIKEKKLRAVDSQTFSEDPLRAVRAAQFAGRLEFRLDPETEKLCKEIVASEEFATLPHERIGEEFLKLLAKAEKPSTGLEVADELGILDHVAPQLTALKEVSQEEEWHPEGNVWTHSKMAVDQAASLTRDTDLLKRLEIALTPGQRLTVILAALCHDLGKKETTSVNEKGQIISHEHAEAGVAPAEELLRSWNISQHTTDAVKALVRDHLWPVLTKDPSDGAVRRLARRLNTATAEMLALVAMADNLGRGYSNVNEKDGSISVKIDTFKQKQATSLATIEAFLARARSLNVAAEKPTEIIKGRHLIPLGIKPGKQMGQIIDKLFQAQMDGEFANENEGLAWFEKNREELTK